MHGGGTAAACVTLTDWPAMVRLPERAGPEFAATVKFTDPPPVPLAPDVIVIHVVLVVAVHVHSLDVVTPTGVAAPPAAGTDCDVGATLYAHPGRGAAPWVTVNVWFAIASVALRSGPLLRPTL